MDSFTFASPINGKPVTIEKPLLPEHIAVGRLLWYEGFTSTFHWNCPAIITRVNKRKKTFKLRSLDDMIEQNQEYSFSVDQDDCDSRKTMRLIDDETVKKYLDEQKVILDRSVEYAESALEQAQNSAAHFNAVRETLRL